MSSSAATPRPGSGATYPSAWDVAAAPRLDAVATALPEHVLDQATARTYAERLFRDLPQLDRLTKVFDNGHVRSRHLVVPPDWFTEPRTFPERNRRYRDAALELIADAVSSALAKAGTEAEEIDQIVLVTSTGIATPSLDAHLLNRIGLPSHVRRTPVWGLGCAGGAAGLAIAADLARARPESRVALVAVEICSLTFQDNDVSKRNLVAASLFGDGAAALLLAGPAVPANGVGGPHPRVVTSRSVTWPDSLDVMGWAVRDTGFEVVFSREIPRIVTDLMAETVDAFLEDVGLDRDRIDHWIAHPGGAKVLTAYQRALELDDARVRHSARVLRECGNMSSPSVFFVLDRTLSEDGPRPGDAGLLMALGPGFSAELVLLAWE